MPKLDPKKIVGLSITVHATSRYGSATVPLEGIRGTPAPFKTKWVWATKLYYGLDRQGPYWEKVRQ